MDGMYDQVEIIIDAINVGYQGQVEQEMQILSNSSLNRFHYPKFGQTTTYIKLQQIYITSFKMHQKIFPIYLKEIRLQMHLYTSHKS